MNQIIYIFDIDDTLIYTTARVHVYDEHKKLICKLDSSSYNSRTHNDEEQLKRGQSYDYSEFNNFGLLKCESHRPTMTILKELARQGQSHNIYIITAREDRYLIAYWLHTLGIDLDLNHIIVNDFSKLPLGQWKANKLNEIIQLYGTGYLDKACLNVHVYEDDFNCKECMAKLDGQYERVFIHIEDINRTWNGI